jgi:hypothetical protein
MGVHDHTGLHFHDQRIRLTPSFASIGQASAEAIARPSRVARRVTAVIRRDGAGSVEISPSLGVDEGDADGETWRVRLFECCDVATVLEQSFGGSWRMVGSDVVYTPRAGTDIADVERGAKAAFGHRGMRARAL